MMDGSMTLLAHTTTEYLSVVRAEADKIDRQIK